MAGLRQTLRHGIIALGFVCTLLGWELHAQTAPLSGETTWRVVVLNNADFLLPASALMDQALRETLTREAPHSIEFFGEALDTFRHPRDLDDVMHALLRRKYDGVKVDLVMARSRGSIEFVRRYGDELWPNVPVVFYNELAESVRTRGVPKASTGVLIDINPADTIELARRLHPRARKIFIVGGTAEYDRNWKRRVEPLLSQLPGDYAVTWLDHLAIPQVLDAVGKLSADSIVVYTSVMIDAEGKTRNNAQIARQVAAASTAPVYGFLETYVGVGILGGAVPDFAGQGRAAARLALRVLGGEPAATIPVQAPLPAQCFVDARAMARFNIDERLLPEGCDVRFRPPSVWRDYRWYVVGAIVAIMLQAILIATLIVQRRQRRRAELAAQQQRVELAHALRLATVGEMTAAISHEINQPLGAILSNADAAEMLLDSDKPSVDHLREILADIRRDDLRASEVVRRIRGLLQKHDVQKQPLDVNDLVFDVIRLIGAEAARREVDIHVQAAPGSPRVDGDRVQLQQLFINLMMNAMDAMGETPIVFRRVTIRVSSHDDGRIEIAVSDAGHGIEAGASKQLFDSFYTTKPRGLGLGLSIARTVAEVHGGNIRALNNQSGGATFCVTLPGKPPESAGEDTAARMTSEARAT